MRDLFQVHKLNPDGIQKARAIAIAFNQLVDQLEAMCPHSRERSLAMTHLEQACIYSKKAMAMKPENQDVEEAKP